MFGYDLIKGSFRRKVFRSVGTKSYVRWVEVGLVVGGDFVKITSDLELDKSGIHMCFHLPCFFSLLTSHAQSPILLKRWVESISNWSMDGVYEHDTILDFRVSSCFSAIGGSTSNVRSFSEMISRFHPPY